MSVQFIDPRGPRFGAGITSALSLGAFAAAIGAIANTALAFILMGLLLFLFAWSVLAPGNHPYQLLFKKLVRPRLQEPIELEDPRPPQFAQKVGLSFAILGGIGVLLVSETIVAIAAAFIFLAAFLNAFFAFCLGCQMYLLLKRAGLLGK
jgi:hypothetical protein